MSQDLSIYTEDYYNRELEEYWFTKNGLLRPDQLAAVCYTFGLPFWGEHSNRREPGLVYSIGCGAGDLEVTLEKLGCEVIGVDPSSGAKHLYKGSELIDEYPGGGDTVIFCEAIEHIPMEQLTDIFNKIPQKARIIIVNWPDYHPLHPDGSNQDHITLIDDELYNKLAKGRKIVLHRGSHLILEGK